MFAQSLIILNLKKLKKNSILMRTQFKFFTFTYYYIINSLKKIKFCFNKKNRALFLIIILNLLRMLIVIVIFNLYIDNKF